MKTTKQHLEALLAVEGDPQFDGVTKSVKSLLHKQSLESHSQSTTFQWIKTSRELSELERKLTEQIERMQSDVGLLPTSSSQEESERDALSLVIGLQDVSEFSRNKNERCHTEMIVLDTKQRLNDMGKDLELQCSALGGEIKTQRHRVLQVVSDVNKQSNIPPSLHKALDSLYTLGDDDSKVEVEFLKQEILGELEGAKHNSNKIRIEQIQKKGMDKIDRLRKRIDEKSRLSANNAKNEAKQQELQAQLQLLRLQKQLSGTQQGFSTLNCNVTNEKVVDVQQRLEAMQALARHHLDRVQDRQKENAEVLLQEEMMKERKRCFNKERSSYREEQRGQRLIAKQEATEKLKRERENQLVRLTKLAMSCPYQKTITALRPDIHKSTNARHHDLFRENMMADFQSGRHTSFSEKKVFSDPKFRLAHSLHEAGINKTIAARDVVRNLIPIKEERTTGIKPY
eukprot:scaffold26715_cov146-Skeletonema_menzelii.AAC.4